MERSIRQWLGVLWHSTEVGNTCSPWASLAPDLSHSRSQWPSACFPSCQADPSKTCCKHTDNKLRKPSRGRRVIIGREIWEWNGKWSGKEKEIWWRTSDRISKGEPDAQVTGNPQSLREGEGKENEPDRVRVKECISCRPSSRFPPPVLLALI